MTRLKSVTASKRPIAAAVLLALCATSALAQATSSDFDRFMKPGMGSKDETKRISKVREVALQEAATVLGAQLGLKEGSAGIIREVNTRAAELDRKYRFGDLLMSAGILPPVISEAKDVVSVEVAAMRVAKAVYVIDAAARPMPGSGLSWRNWLFVGLDDGVSVEPPTDKAILPRDDMELAFWQEKFKAAYAEGRAQAARAYEENFALLDRTYYGMRRFYGLWQAGMVTAPTIVATHDVLINEDPNTIVVGSTMFRITVPTSFTKSDAWKPLGQ